MSKIKIETVFFNKENKDGERLKTKDGKPYIRTVVNDGEKYYTAFDIDGWTQEWKEGDTIDVDVEESEWNGKPQYNIKKKRVDIQKLEERVSKIETYLRGAGRGLERTKDTKVDNDATQEKRSVKQPVKQVEDEIDLDDLGF